MAAMVTISSHGVCCMCGWSGARAQVRTVKVSELPAWEYSNLYFITEYNRTGCGQLMVLDTVGNY